MKTYSTACHVIYALAALVLVAGLGAMVNIPGEALPSSEMTGGTCGPSGPWLATEVVSTESTDSSERASLAVDAAGNVHVAWQDLTEYGGSGTDVDVFYKRWDVSTRAWSATEVVSTESTDGSYYPSLAVDATGSVHIAWHDLTAYGGSGSDIDIFYKRRDAVTGTWSMTEVVSTESPSISGEPSLAVDERGNVHVAWHDWTNHSGSGSDADIFYKCKPAGGAWPAATEVVSTESTDNSFYPSLDVDPVGGVHVAWHDYTNYATSGADADVFYRSKPAGGAWASIEVVSTESTGSSYYPSLATDAAGNVHVAWYDYTDYAGSGTDNDIFYKCKTVGGAWPAATEVVSTESSLASYMPALAVDAGGHPHIAWHDFTIIASSGADADVFYKFKPAGGTWVPTVVASTESTGESVNPSLAVDSAGNVHVAWQDLTDYGSSGTDTDVFYKVSPRIPAAPVLDPVTPGTSTTGSVDVTWLPCDGASWYFVYRAAQPIAWIAGLTPLDRVTCTSYVDTVTANGTWYYAVVAGNAYYNGTVSNSVLVRVAIPPAGVVPVGTVPEVVFYTVACIMACVAVLTFAIGIVVGRRGASPAKGRPAR